MQCWTQTMYSGALSLPLAPALDLTYLFHNQSLYSICRNCNPLIFLACKVSVYTACIDAAFHAVLSRGVFRGEKYSIKVLQIESAPNFWHHVIPTSNQKSMLRFWHIMYSDSLGYIPMRTKRQMQVSGKWMENPLRGKKTSRYHEILYTFMITQMFSYLLLDFSILLPFTCSCLFMHMGTVTQ